MRNDNSSVLRAACSASVPRSEFVDLIPRPVQDALAVAAQPTVEQGGVDAAEVGVDLQVPGVQVRQARVPADHPAPDRRAGHEQARRRPVDLATPATRLSLPITKGPACITWTKLRLRSACRLPPLLTSY